MDASPGLSVVPMPDPWEDSAWAERDLLLFAADCTEHVRRLFGSTRASDIPKYELVVNVARSVARGDTTFDEVRASNPTFFATITDVWGWDIFQDDGDDLPEVLHAASTNKDEDEPYDPLRPDLLIDAKACAQSASTVAAEMTAREAGHQAYEAALKVRGFPQHDCTSVDECDQLTCALCGGGLVNAPPYYCPGCGRSNFESHGKQRSAWTMVSHVKRIMQIAKYPPERAAQRRERIASDLDRLAAMVAECQASGDLAGAERTAARARRVSLIEAFNDRQVADLTAWLTANPDAPNAGQSPLYLESRAARSAIKAADRASGKAAAAAREAEHEWQHLRFMQIADQPLG